jgi:protease I
MHIVARQLWPAWPRALPGSGYVGVLGEKERTVATLLHEAGNRSRVGAVVGREDRYTSFHSPNLGRPSRAARPRLARMAPRAKRALVLAADMFEDIELLYPVYRLKEEGVEVTVAGLSTAPVMGKKGHGPVPVDATVNEVAEAAFDALVLPGGYAPDILRRSPAVLELVRAFDRSAKPIAFICHAGWVPISAGILKGRRATSVAAIRDDMVNAGADWLDSETVVDGNLISARMPSDLGPWMRALLAALNAEA